MPSTIYLNRGQRQLHRKLSSILTQSRKLHTLANSSTSTGFSKLLESLFMSLMKLRWSQNRMQILSNNLLLLITKHLLCCFVPVGYITRIIYHYYSIVCRRTYSSKFLFIFSELFFKLFLFSYIRYHHECADNVAFSILHRSTSNSTKCHRSLLC